MKSSLMKFVIYAAVFLVLGTVIYIFAFLRPNANRIEDLQLRIEDAHRELPQAVLRDERHPLIRLDLEELENTLSIEDSTYSELREIWYNNYEDFLLETFDDWEIRQLIERIVQQANAENLHIADFPFSQPLSMMTYSDEHAGLPRGIWLTPVTISFVTDYQGLLSILNGFAHENIDNRVIRYSLDRQGEQWSINMQLDILTLTPHPERFNGGYVLYDGAE